MFNPNISTISDIPGIALAMIDTKIYPAAIAIINNAICVHPGKMSSIKSFRLSLLSFLFLLISSIYKTGGFSYVPK